MTEPLLVAKSKTAELLLLGAPAGCGGPIAEAAILGGGKRRR